MPTRFHVQEKGAAPKQTPRPAQSKVSPENSIDTAQRVASAPAPVIQPQDMVALQRTVGNRAVTKMVHRQLAPRPADKKSPPPIIAPKGPQDSVIGLDVTGKVQLLNYLGLTSVPPLPQPKSAAQVDKVLDIYLYRFREQMPVPYRSGQSGWEEITHLQIKADLEITKGQKVFNYYDVIQQLNRLKLSEKELREILGKLRAIPEIQSHFAGMKEDDFVRETSIESVISGLPAFVVKDIGGGPDNRYEFMHYMRAYLGPDPATTNHFKAIRKANVPGEVYLHDKAASRLEAVAAKLGGKMPASWVGYGLRGRFRTHTRESNSRMAHPMGYAVDYRPYEAPMITDSRLVELFDLQAGGATHFDPDKVGGYRQRRDFIQQMGQGTADPQKVATFFKNFEDEYNRIKKASTDFQTSLADDLKKELFSLRDEYVGLQKSIADVTKKLKKAKKPEEQAALAEEKKKHQDAVEVIRSKLSTVFKPWLDKLAEQKKGIEKLVPNVGQIPAKGELNKQIKAAQQGVDAKKKQKKDLEKKKVPQDQIDVVTQEIQAADAKLQELKQMLNNYGQKQRWDTLTQLETSLQTDLKFVFAKDVRNPGITQLLETGFFKPDEEPAEGQKFNPNKHGFNLAFMKLMAEHGFDQGISWGASSVDSMHFELVEGVDSLPNPDTVKTALGEASKKIKRK